MRSPIAKFTGKKKAAAAVLVVFIAVPLLLLVYLHSKLDVESFPLGKAPSLLEARCDRR